MDDAVTGNAPAPCAEPPGTGDVPYVVTLVHGTWAKKAPWTAASSLLSTQLKTRLPAGSKILPFAWSGKNTNAARRLAAEHLLTQIECLVNKHRAARHYIIAHSHGGNVALHALARASFKERISGVACLSTPFLVARQRDLGRNGAEHTAGAILGVIGLTIWSVLATSSPAGLFGLVKVIALGLAVAAEASVFIALWRSWRLYGDRLLSDLELPKCDSTSDRDKILIVRSPGDEASGALAFVQILSQVGVGLYLRVMGWYERLKATARRWTKPRGRLIAVAVGSVLAAMSLLYVFVIWLPREQAGVWMFAEVMILYSVAAAAIALAFEKVDEVTFVPLVIMSALMWPLMILLSIALLPFGWEFAVANLLLDVSAETTPPGVWTVHLVEPPTSEELQKDEPAMRHSVVYENSQVLELLSDWMTGAREFQAPAGDG